MQALDVAVRFGLYLDLMTAFGVAFFALCVPQVRAALPLPAIVATTSIVGVALSAFGLLVIAASMAGVPVSRVDAASVTMVLTGMSLGKAWVARIAGLAVAAGSTTLFRRRPRTAMAATSAGGAIALGSLVWAGHGAMDDGAIGWLHLWADIAHVIAAGAWVGALISLLLLVGRPAAMMDDAHLAATHRALAGFAVTGTAVVTVIVATGLVNVVLLVGASNLAHLPSLPYGRLLIAKLLLFAAMLGFAANNRYRLTPGLAARLTRSDHHGAIVALRISVALEAGCAVLVLTIVAWLGVLPPPVSGFPA